LSIIDKGLLNGIFSADFTSPKKGAEYPTV